MILIVLLIAILVGWFFFKLARTYGKNKWMYAFVGALIFYAGTAISGFFLGVIGQLFRLGLDYKDNLALSLLTIPFGVVIVFFFYRLMRNFWKNASITNSNKN